MIKIAQVQGNLSKIWTRLVSRPVWKQARIKTISRTAPVRRCVDTNPVSWFVCYCIYRSFSSYGTFRIKMDLKSICLSIKFGAVALSTFFSSCSLRQLSSSIWAWHSMLALIKVCDTRMQTWTSWSSWEHLHLGYMVYFLLFMDTQKIWWVIMVKI